MIGFIQDLKGASAAVNSLLQWIEREFQTFTTCSSCRALSPLLLLQSGQFNGVQLSIGGSENLPRPNHAVLTTPGELTIVPSPNPHKTLVPPSPVSCTDWSVRNKKSFCRPWKKKFTHLATLRKNYYSTPSIINKPKCHPKTHSQESTLRAWRSCNRGLLVRPTTHRQQADEAVEAAAGAAEAVEEASRPAERAGRGMGGMQSRAIMLTTLRLRRRGSRCLLSLKLLRRWRRRRCRGGLR